MKISAIITLKKDVLDPQGKVIHQTLDGMGFKDVNEVRQGKYFEIDVKENDPIKAKSFLHISSTITLALVGSFSFTSISKYLPCLTSFTSLKPIPSNV